jgi:hypothetical protein
LAEPDHGFLPTADRGACCNGWNKMPQYTQLPAGTGWLLDRGPLAGRMLRLARSEGTDPEPIRAHPDSEVPPLQPPLGNGAGFLGGVPASTANDTINAAAANRKNAAR